jgi:hypothetical protein
MPIENYLQLLDPTLILVILGLSSGLVLGRSFKKIDFEIKKTQKFMKSSKFKQYLISAALNSIHHFQFGLALMYFAYRFHGSIGDDGFTLMYSFGFGLVVDDAPDLPRRFRKYFSYLIESEKN